jgi:hypothetical protein
MCSAPSSGISQGDKVYLRNCPTGQPGSVLREERGRIVVDWCDLKFIGRHRAASLVLAEIEGTGSNCFEKKVNLPIDFDI